jgi:hypothetical protein
MPAFGALIGKQLFVLMDTSDFKIIRHDSNLYCGIMLILAVFSLFSAFG